MAKTLQSYEFLSKFDKLKESNVYLIYGVDQYSIDKILALLIKKYVRDDARSFDFDTLYGDDTKAENILQVMDMLPFISARRVVIIKSFDKLSAAELKRTADYFANPAPDTIAILTAEKIDKRQKVFKNIADKGIVVECKQPYSTANISGWLKNELRVKNARMDASAINAFVNSIELDYQVASNELEKIVLLSGDNKIISRETVIQSLSGTRNNTVYDLQKTLGMRDLKGSLKIADNLDNNDESYVFLISVITNLFMTLWKMKALKKKNISNDEISKRYMEEIFPFFRKDYFNYMNKYKMDELDNIFRILHDADSDFKLQDPGVHSVIFTKVIFEICR